MDLLVKILIVVSLIRAGNGESAQEKVCTEEIKEEEHRNFRLCDEEIENPFVQIPSLRDLQRMFYSRRRVEINHNLTDPNFQELK